MTLRRRLYLEAGKTHEVEVPNLKTLGGLPGGEVRRKWDSMRAGQEFDARKAAFHALTWTKRKGYNEQWSLVRLERADGEIKDIFINFYEQEPGSLTTITQQYPIYLVAFDRRDPYKTNLLSTNVASVRAAKKAARDWLKTYVMRQKIAKVTRIATNTKL